MAIFRNLTFQRILSLTFLCSALLSQTQILYACELMDGKPKLVCCCGESMPDACPMSKSCAMQDKSVWSGFAHEVPEGGWAGIAQHENTEKGHCCDVSQDSLTDVASAHSSSTVDFLTLLLDGPQPPPPSVIDYQELLSASLQTTGRLAIPPHEPLLLSGGKQTYLLTRRLRL